MSKVVRLRELYKLNDEAEAHWKEPSIYYEPGKTATKGVGWSIIYGFRGADYMQVPSYFRKQSAPITLDLCAGAGGMSTGLIQAGFDVRYLVEKDPTIATTLAWNHENGKVFPMSVKTFLERCKTDGFKGYPAKNTVEHTHMSSPCQGFSKANRTGGKNDETNNQVSLQIVDVIKYHTPQTGTFENVVGILDTDNVIYLKKIIFGLLSINYHARVAGKCHMPYLSSDCK